MGGVKALFDGRFLNGNSKFESFMTDRWLHTRCCTHENKSRFMNDVYLARTVLNVNRWNVQNYF